LILLVSLAYVAAAGALFAAIVLRADGRVVRRLKPPTRTPSLDLVAWLGRRLPFALTPTVEARIVEMAFQDGRDGFRGTKLLAGAGGGLVGAAGTSGVGWAAALLIPLLSVAGFRLPDVVLARRVAARRAATAGDVPQLLDVLAVSVSAGLSPRSALDRAPEAVGDPLAGELRRARDEVTLGLPWRSALRRTAQRTRSRDLRRLAVTLERSERLGAPIGDRLVMLADEVRSERRARREERARRAPVQMLFPLVFLILPAFVLAAVVPAILVATRGLT
jgi:tight adherence protein C